MTGSGVVAPAEGAGAPPAGVRDPEEPLRLLLRDLRASPSGLSVREARRRLVVSGPNELRRRAQRRWPRELLQQFTHPLALLLAAAAIMAAASGSSTLAIVIAAVILLNALVAFVQEQQAERAVEALSRYLPPRATVVRDGHEHVVDAREIVPGDVLVIEEGDRICADARLLEGAIEVDISTLTGESLPAFRSADLADTRVPVLQARDLVFSGTACTEGQARALVFATGMQTELGRIAALSERIGREESPLERQVRRVAWLIAAVAVAAGLAFLPLGTLAAGLPLRSAVSFSIGLLVANVPEGLLPTITLALAVGVRQLARRGALVKRLSAVETLGSTTVICTDKTGTLTENRMRVTAIWSAASLVSFEEEGDGAVAAVAASDAALSALAAAMSACSNADADPARPEEAAGDATEVAMLLAAARLGADVSTGRRGALRRRQFHFDPALRLMSTVDSVGGRGLAVHCKGAPEAVLARSTHLVLGDGTEVLLDGARRSLVMSAADRQAERGLRVLAVARRDLPPGADPPRRREEAERELRFLGLVAMFDPPRSGVAGAVAACRAAGIRVIVVTGDAGLTAREVARRVGIASDGVTVVTGERLDRMSEAELDALLRSGGELIFARSSPEAKLRIADALRAEGHVVAMTGDGVNDAPALRRADIGVAMGRSGTDVAREAATMVLTDDDFATIVAAIEAGRRVYDNVRKFILYIFVHAVPEVVPFLVFALAGGAVPAPLTPLQILCIDLGTDTVPALALSREPAEPGLMTRPPRPSSERIIRGPMLLRAWGFLGAISALLVMAGFFSVLVPAGWRPGANVGPASPLHDVYLRATTMTFLGIVACQVGTVFAARSEHAGLRAIGLLSNPLVVRGVVFAVAVAAALVLAPPLQAVFGMAAPHPDEAVRLLPFPFVVWGADELRKWAARRR